MSNTVLLAVAWASFIGAYAIAMEVVYRLFTEGLTVRRKRR